MIAAKIGRTFLKAYNEKYNKAYSAKEFFEKEFFRYFFDAPKYMQWVTNSPFVQMKKGQKVHLLNAEERQEKLMNLHTKIDNGEIDASTAIGFPASEVKEYGKYSGLVSDIDRGLEKEDIYSSWIGGGLGIGVAGGYSIYFDNEEILLSVYEGWKIYRQYLDDPILEKLRGNQINTWNGQWLSFVSGKDYVPDYDYNTFQRNNVFNITDKVLEVNTIKWSKLFFSLSYRFKDLSIIGYIFSLGKENKTLGFYPFQFNKARTLRLFYRRLFGEQAAIEQAKEYEKLFGIHIKRACELGSFGLQALEPKDLRKYYGNASTLKLVKPTIKLKKGETEEAYKERKNKAQQKDLKNIIDYRTYKTWLLAMITKNKEENLKYSEEIAKALFTYKKQARVEKKFVEEEVFKSHHKKAFLQKLHRLIEIAPENTIELFKGLTKYVYLMNEEDFQYLFILIKIEFAYQERINNNKN